MEDRVTRGRDQLRSDPFLLSQQLHLLLRPNYYPTNNLLIPYLARYQLAFAHASLLMANESPTVWQDILVGILLWLIGVFVSNQPLFLPTKFISYFYVR